MFNVEGKSVSAYIYGLVDSTITIVPIGDCSEQIMSRSEAIARPHSVPC